MRLKVLLLSFIIAASAAAQEIQYNWMPIINAIAYIESGFDEKIVSKSGTYVGYLQIGPSMVTECNSILKAKGINKRYTLEDRKDKGKSIEMFILVQEKYNPEHNVEKAIRLWNGGPGYSVKTTTGYYNRVMRRLAQDQEKEEDGLT
jgi:hypothetical protein